MARRSVLGKRKKPLTRKELRKKVEFNFYAPLAKRVSVAGTFNSWNTNKNVLKKDRSGNWKCALKLDPGKYEYRYWIDDHFENSQNEVEQVQNEFGSTNCVLSV